MIPRVSRVDFWKTCRLIPTKYACPAFEALYDDDQELQDLADIEGATNDRLMAQEGLKDGIGPPELVYNVSYSNLVNAAFAYASPKGGRFNSPDRGGWYASLDKETSLEEVIYHQNREFEEIDYWQAEAQKDFWHADFQGDFHDIRNDTHFDLHLGEDPETAYPHSQKLAARLLDLYSAGLVFPAVRNRGGTNIVCFRPALVDNVQKGETITLKWNGTKRPEVIGR